MKPLLVVDRDSADPAKLAELEKDGYRVLEVALGARVQLLGGDSPLPAHASGPYPPVVIADADSGLTPTTLTDLGYTVLLVKSGARVRLLD